jgi:glycogen(starch) synthase
MRILHVLDHSIPLHSGYTFRTAAILAEQRRRGWETFHLTTPKQENCTVPVETVDGLRFHRTLLPQRHRPPVLAEFALIQATRRRLDEVIEEVRPDLLHAHSPALNAVATWLAARRHRLPWVYEIRSFWEDAAVEHGTTRHNSLRYRATRALETFCCRRADAVFTICEGLRSDLVNRGLRKDHIGVISNSVDPAEFPPRSRDDALARDLGLDGAFVAGFVGSFYAYEGLDLLLDTAQLMRAERQQFRFLLVGAIRKPVVATDIGGHREMIVDGETGLLFPENAPDALAARLRSLQSDPSLRARIVDAAHRYMLSERTWQSSVGRYEAVYRRLAAAAA